MSKSDITITAKNSPKLAIFSGVEGMFKNAISVAVLFELSTRMDIA